VERTAGRIHNLEVELVADHLVIRGQAPAIISNNLRFRRPLMRLARGATRG
jgi:hypothetical protein